MVEFLEQETAKILLFLDPDTVKMDQQISGFKNCRNDVLFGSRNRRKGQRILYEKSRWRRNKHVGVEYNILYFISEVLQHELTTVWIHY